MNSGAGVNYGNALRGNRRTAQPSPAEELDVGNVDVNALLADNAHQDRAWTQKLQGLQAQQALNALQKVSMTINVYTLGNLTHSHLVDVRA
jgi:hypothetical protein